MSLNIDHSVDTKIISDTDTTNKEESTVSQDSSKDAQVNGASMQSVEETSPAESTALNNREDSANSNVITVKSEPNSTVDSTAKQEEVTAALEISSALPIEAGEKHESGRITEESDDGLEFKDAEVSKDSAEVSDTDSHSQCGSEANGENMPAGRRSRRDSVEISKDNESDEDSANGEVGDYEPQGARESGDGEEKIKDKEVDRDEDKKDPQYIPKKGVFYEHDDRTADSRPTNAAEEPKETKKKKVVADKIDRWGHDMFDNSKQSPKSTQDLIDYYGYDIRNEEEPPKAWRSRRYGRGPNKYTRSWQDEAAYRNKRKQVLAKPNKPQQPFKNNVEDFPTVEQSKSGFRRGKNTNFNNSRESGSRERVRPQNKSRSDPDFSRKHPDNISNIPVEKVELSRVRPERSLPINEIKYNEVQVEKSAFLNKKKPFSSKTKSEVEAEADLAALSKEFSNAVINLGRDGKILPIRAQTTLPSHGSNAVPVTETLEKEAMHQSRVEVSQIRHESQIPSRQTTTSNSSGIDHRPKEKKEAGNQGNMTSSKSKRYSTQRQRSLPQSSHLQQGGPGPQPAAQQFLHQQQFYAAPPPQTAPDPVPDSALFSGFQGNPPPVYTDSMQGVVFLPGYPPTPPPHLLNYCPPPPQQFGMPPPLGPPPPDMYPPQPPPGITYYSPQSQVQPRPPASRRVKVAIPIVAPPDQQSQSDQTCS